MNQKTEWSLFAKVYATVLIFAAPLALILVAVLGVCALISALL